MANQAGQQSHHRDPTQARRAGGSTTCTPIVCAWFSTPFLGFALNATPGGGRRARERGTRRAHEQRVSTTYQLGVMLGAGVGSVVAASLIATRAV